MKATRPTALGAIDVGTNAARLKIVRVMPGGVFSVLHEERDAIRPGEGVFRNHVMGKAVADRLLATLQRFGALCKRYGAVVRAVATSAVREAGNQAEILERVERECGFPLEVISGTEEARLTCLGVLRGEPAQRRSLLIDMGGGSTEVAFAKGESPVNLWSLGVGTVRVSELFDTQVALTGKQLEAMREAVAGVVNEGLPSDIAGAPACARGCSGSIRALVEFAGTPGTATATDKQIGRAVKQLAGMTAAERGAHFDASRSEVILAGAVIVEAVMARLHLDSIVAVPSGLREGILIDMASKAGVGAGSV